jgi:uncharacterized delta-60 repeat protein
LDQTFNGSGYFTHHNAAGGNFSDHGQSVAVMPDGRIVVAGYSYNENQNKDMAVWMLNPDGTLDTSFNGKGWFTHHNSAGGNSDESGNSVAITTDGKIVVAGYSMGVDSMKAVVWCLNEDGTFNSSFNPMGTSPGWIVLQEPDVVEAFNPYMTLTSLAVTDDDKIIVAGSQSYVTDRNDPYFTYNHDLIVWRLMWNGTLDFSFNGTGIFMFGAATEGRYSHWMYSPRSITVDTNKKILIAGYHMSPTSGISSGGIWRFTVDGRLDLTFNESGYLFPTDDDWYISRFNSIAVAEGKILVTCEIRIDTIEDDSGKYFFGILDFGQSGNLETIYRRNIANGHQQEGLALAITSDHQAIVGGYTLFYDQGYEPDRDMAIWWQDLDETDSSPYDSREYFTQNFGIGPFGNDVAADLAVTSDGKIVVTGYSENENGDPDMAVWQFH